MITETGHFALILALAVACVQCGSVIWASARRDEAARALATTAALTQFALLAFAFGALVSAYVASDFSVRNVAANSHSAKPLIYKITGTWGNHEGSMLLWAVILSAFGAAVAAFGNNLPSRLKSNVLAVQGAVGIAFLAFIVITSNPFIRRIPAPFEGNGLNPVLQDLGLAIHPPLLYAGYVGLSIAYSFAVAALFEGQIGTAWARWVRPWTLAAWMFLTLGIATGSWWAYYELGWGGWWFWDPVENASLMPWLAATALLHSAIVMEKREALKAWSVFLAIFAFTLSLIGTFIVRSGVLTSVHAFAVDPARGVFVLAIIIGFGFGALALFAVRAPGFRKGGLFAPVSRETSLLFNNLILTIACLAILKGTLYPMAVDALYGEKISVGAPFFNAVFAWFMVPFLFAVPFGPFLAWKRGDLVAVAQRLMLPAWLAVIAMAVTYFAIEGGPILAPFPVFLAAWVALGATPLLMDAKGLGWVMLARLIIWAALAVCGLFLHGPTLSSLGIGLGVWLIAGALAEVAFRAKAFEASGPEVWRRLGNLPRSNYGTALAHIGVGLSVLGIVATSAWRQELVVAVKPGEKVEFAGYALTFHWSGVRPGPNFQEDFAVFSLARAPSAGEPPPRPVTTLMPAKRKYSTAFSMTTETAIYRAWAGDYYLAVSEIPPGNGPAEAPYERGPAAAPVVQAAAPVGVRIYFNPLVRLIWLGGLVMVAGGLFSLADRRLRVGAPQRNRQRDGDGATPRAAGQTI